MPASRSHQHTAKADRMAAKIEKEAKKEGRYKRREERVAWATVHKELPKKEAQRTGSETSEWKQENVSRHARDSTTLQHAGGNQSCAHHADVG